MVELPKNQDALLKFMATNDPTDRLSVMEGCWGYIATLNTGKVKAREVFVQATASVLTEALTRQVNTTQLSAMLLGLDLLTMFPSENQLTPEEQQNAEKFGKAMRDRFMHFSIHRE